jgi:hypothetical protein
VAVDEAGQRDRGGHERRRYHHPERLDVGEPTPSL